MYAEAEADYRAALQLQPGSTSATIGIAFVYLQSQREAEAAGMLEQVASTHPTFFVYYLLGELRLREGANDLALEHFKKSAALEPTFGPTHTNLGKIYLKKNDAVAAVRELEQAVQLERDDTTAHYQLSIAYRRNGEREKAQQALARVKGLNQEQRELGLTKFLTRKLRKVRSSTDSPF
jgi:tetratricopeptide (TPR) repeat protein